MSEAHWIGAVVLVAGRRPDVTDTTEAVHYFVLALVYEATFALTLIGLMSKHTYSSGTYHRIR